MVVFRAPRTRRKKDVFYAQTTLTAYFAPEMESEVLAILRGLPCKMRAESPAREVSAMDHDLLPAGRSDHQRSAPDRGIGGAATVRELSAMHVLRREPNARRALVGGPGAAAPPVIGSTLKKHRQRTALSTLKRHDGWRMAACRGPGVTKGCPALSAGPGGRGARPGLLDSRFGQRAHFAPTSGRYFFSPLK